MTWHQVKVGQGFFMALLSDFFQANGEVGRIIEVMDFQVASQIFRFTTNETEVTFLNLLYEPVTLKSEGLEFNNEVTPIKNTFTMEITEPAVQFLANTPAPVMKAKITWFLESDESVFSVMYDGRVLSASFNKERICTLNLESKTEIFTQQEPNVIHSPMCNNVLFDSGCKLLESNFTDTINLTTVNGKVLTSSDFALQPDGYYFKGKIKTNFNDFRLVTKHVGDTVEIHVPFDSRVTALTQVFATPGCLRRFDQDCVAKFSNEANFKGMLDIPSRNIVVWGLEGLDE